MGLSTKEMIETVIIFMVWLAVTPVIVSQVATMQIQAKATATEWNFTGAEGAKILLGLAPFIWVAVGLLGIFLSLLIYARTKATV